METLELFSYLIKKGYAWELQGSYLTRPNGVHI